MLDKIDKSILKVLLRNRQRNLTTNQVAIKSQIAPLTASRHLSELENKGFVKRSVSGKIRDYTFKANIGKTKKGLRDSMKKVKAPSKINWNLRYKE